MKINIAARKLVKYNLKPQFFEREKQSVLNKSKHRYQLNKNIIVSIKNILKKQIALNF